MKEIQLTQGQVAIVDDEDFEWLNQWKWSAQWIESTQSYRAIRKDYSCNKPKTIMMHRLVMNTPDDMKCDHIHHNTLDNRKSELRNVTNSQNMMNSNKHKDGTSIYKGVSKHGNKWQAYLRKNGKRAFCGTFSTEIEAAQAYDQAAKQIFGDFANTNFS